MNFGIQDQIFVQPSHLIDIIIEGSLKRKNDKQNFLYEYNITNLKSSVLPLNRIDVEIKSNIENITAPSVGKWRIGKYNKLGWSENFPSRNDIINWSSRENTVSTLPCGKSYGFSYESKDFPGLVKCFANGIASKDSKTNNNPRYTDFFYDAIPKGFEDKVRGRTVGAVDRFKTPVEGADRLIEYTKASFEEGWIEDKKLYDKLLQDAEDLRTIVNSRQRNEVKRNRVNAYMNFINGKEKELLSEAYALLYYNAEYIKELFEK